MDFNVLTKKLFDEVDRVLQGKDPMFEDLDKLVYTTWVWKETLRLHPPVNSTPRRSNKSFKIGEKKLPKGTIITLHIGGVHLHPQYWENPKEFIPERFDETKNKITPFTYFPFSIGKRNCIGEKFATIEGRIALTMIAQRFKIEFDENIDVNKYFETINMITTVPKHDLKLQFKLRSKMI